MSVDPTVLTELELKYCKEELDKGWTLIRVREDIFSNTDDYERAIEMFGPRLDDDPKGKWEYPSPGFMIFLDPQDALLFKLSM